MGASASLLSEGEWADSSVKEVIDTVEQLQFDVNSAHLKFLDEQKLCLFKKHDKIISLLTSKTKRQLHNMFTIPDLWTVNSLNDFLGGKKKDYANFLSRLATPRLPLKLLDLKTATEGLGADLDILASILCVSTPAEIATMLEFCTANDFDVNFAISKKTNGLPQKFFLGILSSNRDNYAPQNVESEVNTLLNAQQPDSMDDFFSVLVSASFDQLSRYDAFLQEKHTTNMNSLEKLIDKKLARNPIAKFVKVFIQPPVTALAQTIFNNIRNIKLMTMILTRYEKSYLHEVDVSMMECLHKSGLNQLITSSMSGQVAKCIKGWLVNKTPCNGKEAECEKYIHDYMAQGYDLPALLAWGESCAAIKKFFEEQKTELESYCRTMKIVKAGTHHPDEDVSEFVNAPLAYQWDEMPAIDAEGDDDYESQLKIVHDYCHQQFYNVDVEHTGVLGQELFWETLYNMPVMVSAFTTEESQLMREWADFGQNEEGVVYEDTLREISESIVGGIVNKGVSTVRALLEANGYTPGVTKRPSMKGDKVSPSLLEYLHEGFDALDHEGKGTLSKIEFWEFISLLNLGLLDHDFDNIMNKWAYGQAEEISWKDVIGEFTDLMHSMCSDNRDHFIGLVDKSSQLGFWYNLRDGSSEWMNEEQNQYFQEQIDAQYYSKTY